MSYCVWARSIPAVQFPAEGGCHAETAKAENQEGVMNLRPAVLACVVFVIGWVSRLPAQEPAKELAWKYHEPFQGTPRQAKDFVLFGADAARLVKYEADGLRIALPAG